MREMLRDGLRDSADWMGALMRVSPRRPAGQRGAACCPNATWAWWRRTSWTTAPAAGRSGRCVGRHPLGQMTVEDLQGWAVDFLRPQSHGCRACAARGPRRGRGA